ncbi:MAG: T9SS type A sorting domain-containing protein [Cytophagaceae bacterium]|nr:T9SS type A sorting domain-containing protein [Cytophagaceae bacterium]
MKKLFTLLCLAAIPAIAQPTFTTIATPTNNTAVSSRSAVYTGTLPTTGANQTWDYSALTFPNAPTTSIAHTNINNSPRASSFPTANYYEQAADGGEIFYKVTTTSSSILGNYSAANSVTIVNSNPQTTLTVPFSYGETQNDTYSGNYIANSIPVSKSGLLQVDYNGYGTLKTPDGTFTNVPLLKAVSDETHVFQITADFSYSQRFVSTTYSWGYPGGYSFIFAIVKIEAYDMFGNLSGTSTNALKIEQIPTGIFNTANENTATVFPQPAKDQVTISADKLQGQYTATIYNLQGDVLKSDEGYALDHALTLNVQSITKGIYLVEINNEGQLLRSKLVVQ